jgi:hypothetical protein
MRTILKHASRKAAGDKREYWMTCARAAADRRLTQGARNRLVDPAGGRYPAAQITDSGASARLIDWSGDGTRALVGLPGSAVEQVTLASGRVHQVVSLPAGVTVLGYTRPDGFGILGESTSAASPRWPGGGGTAFAN